MDKYLVFGNPIKHSKSPIIHALFAKQTQQNISYEKQLAELDAFPETVKAFFAEGGKGCNVTVPFKEQAFQLADKVSEGAKLAQAANTLKVADDGTIYADNTDGQGFVLDLQTNDAPLKDATILLIGAGGAASGVIKPLLACQPKTLYICNRTFSKAQDLAKRFSEFGNIQAIACEELSQQSESFDLVINSTSASLSGDLPPVSANIFKACQFAYDMAYGNEPTVFINWALEHGAQKAIDGLGMLVGQAAKSFEIWRGVQPEITPVLNELRKTL